MPTRSHTDCTWCSKWLDAAVPGEGADQRKDLGDAFRIDRHGGLVENDDVRILDQRVGDPQTLPHSAGVRVHAAVSSITQTRLLQEGRDPIPRLLALEAVQACRIPQVLPSGERGVEPNVVGEVADPALDLERRARGVESHHFRLAFGRLGEAEQHQDRRCLPGAVRPEEAEDLAGEDLEIKAVDGGELPVLLRKAPGADRRFAGHGYRRP
jgi:hypothetical protein